MDELLTQLVDVADEPSEDDETGSQGSCEKMHDYLANLQRLNEGMDELQTQRASACVLRGVKRRESQVGNGPSKL